MCGIAGFVHLDPQRPASRERLRSMTDVVTYRGPDGEGHHVSGPVALGHRRLSIIDLQTGDQPMASPDGSVVIVYNGEIYNYIELRDELMARGHTFHTTSDTEVIIHSYLEWGLDCQSRFNGMWALALWDESRHRLWLSRDRLGEKPLHYAMLDETLVFGSEMKSLFAFGIPRRLDLSWSEVFCCLGYLPAPHSFFKNVHKLPPGSFLVCEGSVLRVAPYWQLPELDERHMRSDEEGIKEEFTALLQDAVRIRMRSDVPFGAFLSGGLDSSSVVACMSDCSREPVRTFTIGFQQKEYDERPLARLVAEKFKTAHHEHIVEPDDFEQALARVVRHYDEPFGDSSAIPTGHVSKMARQHVKMVLTGDGGDEVLSGYTMYQGEEFARLYGRLPRALRGLLPSLVGMLAVPFRGRLRYRLNRVRSVLGASNLPFAERMVEKLSWTEPALVKELLGQRDLVPIEEYLEQRLSTCPYHDPFYRIMHYHLTTSLPDDMLVKVDRMSMAYSLEVRTPFLDHRLVELMARVDKRVKMRGLQRKMVLRDTIGRRLPAALLQAPKKGFGVPIAEWFQHGGFELYARELLNSEGMRYAPRIMERILARNAAGEVRQGNFLYLLIVLNRFVEDAA